MEGALQQSARVEVSAPARAALCVLMVGVLITSVPAPPSFLTAVTSVASRLAGVHRVRPPPSRLMAIENGSAAEIVALPFVSDEHLKGAA